MNISIHALLAESDRRHAGDRRWHQVFLSTLSLRRATEEARQWLEKYLHFYPRSPCGERLCGALLKTTEVKFLSTLSLRRATLGCPAVRQGSDHFYPRSPCGERPSLPNQGIFMLIISIHALLAESDHEPPFNRQPHPTFLSTLSLRRATKQQAAARRAAGISIHALLAESDKSGYPPRRLVQYFYPRSPCGERRQAIIIQGIQISISIHALLAESDAEKMAKRLGKSISIHALLAESDIFGSKASDVFFISIHALLAESDHPDPARFPRATHFYPRSPCGERRHGKTTG